MTALTIRLPASLHKEVKALAKEEGVSINQFLTLIVSNTTPTKQVPTQPL